MLLLQITFPLYQNYINEHVVTEFIYFAHTPFTYYTAIKHRYMIPQTTAIVVTTCREEILLAT